MTTTKDATIQEVLDQGDLTDLGNAAKKIELGKVLAPVKAVFTGLADVAAHDITTAASKAAATVTGIDALETDEMLPDIGTVVSVRTTAGTLAVHGAHTVADAGGTALVPNAAYAGVCLLSDDGKTLTFQAGVTAFVLVYRPRPKLAVTTRFAPNT